MSRRLLVIGAHSADFVWRAGGAIAVATSGGGTAQVLALTYGERGESGELWKEEGMTVERVKEIRREEAERAAAHLGASFESLDLGDYPLVVDKDGLNAIAAKIREFAPDVLLTHTDRDPFNPDHAEAFFAVEKARALAAGRRHGERVRRAVPAAGAPALRAAPARALQLHPDRLRRHHAGDRQEAGGDGRDAARSPTCTPTTTSSQRGEATTRAAPPETDAVKFAEAFQRVTPQVVDSL